MNIKVITVSSDDHEKMGFLKKCEENVSKFGYEHLISVDYDGIGQSFYRNQWLKYITCEDIVIYLDADDYLNVDIRKALPLIDYYDIVYGDYMGVNKDTYEQYISMEFDKEILLKQNYIPFSGTIIRGETAKKGYFYDIKSGNDWAYWIQLMRDGSEFVYSGLNHSYRRLDTSYKKYNTPIIRTIKRKLNNYRSKKLNYEIWNKKKVTKWG